MPTLVIDKDRCIGCGQCAADCLPQALQMRDGSPAMVKEESCMDCHHCLAVCPVGALTINGHGPGESAALEKLPAFSDLCRLVKGRRSVRRYKPDNIPAADMRELLDAAAHAPTGVNARQLWVGVIDDASVMQAFRSEVYAAISRLAAQNAVPPSRRSAFFIRSAQLWQEKGEDAIFRGAPHCLLVGNHKDAPCRDQDPFIYLSYLELLAQSRGLGTCWCGLAYWCLTLVLPDFLPRLGLPETHVFSYAMLLGQPAIHYARTVERGPATVHTICW